MAKRREVWRQIRRVTTSNGVITRHFECGHTQESEPLFNFAHAVSMARSEVGTRVRCAECERHESEGEAR